MNKKDEIADINERHWEKMVKEGCGFTRPWLDLDFALVRQYAEGKLESVPEQLIEIYPTTVLADVEGKDVLCLASGGGQQSAVFGLLGARVTVVDLAEGQLDGDRRAAAHYGYEVATIRADMRDLSCIGDESFDLYSPFLHYKLFFLTFPCFYIIIIEMRGNRIKITRVMTLFDKQET